MTSLSSEWSLDEELALIKELSAVVAKYGSATRLRLMVAPADVAVAADEVLVQRVDTTSGRVFLEPARLSDLSEDDLLHESTTVDLHDTAYVRHAEAMRGASCIYRFPDGKNHKCIYD